MWLTIYASHAGVNYEPMRYLYYTKREAIRKYRAMHGLVGKRIALTVLKGGVIATRYCFGSTLCRLLSNNTSRTS